MTDKPTTQALLEAVAGHDENPTGFTPAEHAELRRRIEAFEPMRDAMAECATVLESARFSLKPGTGLHLPMISAAEEARAILATLES